MQTQHATTLTPHPLNDAPLTGDPPRRPDLRVVRIARSRRLFRAFGIVTAALVATGGYVHFCLYRHGYRTIPKIGVGFGLQVVTSGVVVAALLIGPHLVGRLAGRARHRPARRHPDGAGRGRARRRHPGRVRAHPHAGRPVQLPRTRPPTGAPGA